MESVRRRLLGELAMRRALGVVILATLASVFGHAQREDLYEEGGYLTADERTWTAWFETGAFIAAIGLVFIAIALIFGRPASLSTDETTARAARLSD